MSSKDLVRVRVRGKDFQGWQQSEIERSLETIAGTFQIPITYDWRAAPVIARQDPVQVLVGEQVVISGYCLAAEPFYTATEVGLRIIGRDRSGDLVRSSALAGTGQWRGATLETIARDLLQPFGLGVQSDVATAPIADFKLSHGETVLDALARAARLCGVLVMRSDSGGVLLTRAGKARCPWPIVGGTIAKTRAAPARVISMDGMGTDENRFSVYTAFAQGETDSAADFEAARTLKARATDPEILRHLPLVINADGQRTQAELKALVEHTARVRRGQAYGLRYKLEGWLVDGKPWPLNARVAIFDDIAGLDGEEWLITSVKQDYDLREGAVTELVVKPVEAYELVPLKAKQKRERRKRRRKEE